MSGMLDPETAGITTHFKSRFKYTCPSLYFHMPTKLLGTKHVLRDFLVSEYAN